MKRYALRRFHRTYPLYLTVVVSCTIIGCLFSTLPAVEYFTHAQTWRYLLYNAIFLNFAEPSLPGVFTANEMSAVNGSLWFMKVLVLFYAILPVIVWLMRRLGKLTVLSVLFVLSVVYLELCDHLYATTSREIFNLLRHQTPGCLPYFIAGMAVLLYLEHFRKYLWGWGVTALTIWLLTQYAHCPAVVYLSPMVYAVVLFSLGLFLRPLRLFSHVPDITYGLYLIHSPVIQALLEECKGAIPWVLFTSATIITALLAYLGWQMTERLYDK